VVLVAASFMVGAATSWWLREYRADRYQSLVVVVHEAEVAGLCANALAAGEKGKVAVVQRLLESRMSNAVREAAARVGSASPPDLAVPNLIEGVNRTRRYAMANGMSGVVGNCDLLLGFLMKSNARA
jgi:hypothetical protein